MLAIKIDAANQIGQCGIDAHVGPKDWRPFARDSTMARLLKTPCRP